MMPGTIATIALSSETRAQRSLARQAAARFVDLARAAPALCALWLLNASASGQTAPAKPQMSDQAFKNVTVLKGIPVDEFMNTMGFISASTNYNCIDCHVEPKVEGDWSTYAQETPRKATARRMIQMVETINKTNFAGARVVTCYTCHRNLQGAPKITPRLAEQYGEPPELDPNEVEVTRQSPDAPSADQVFDKYLQAVGGAQKAAAITSIVFKGTYEGYAEPKAAVDIYVKAPNQRAMIVHTALGDSSRIYDGRAGWIASPDRPVGLLTLTGGNLEGARIDALVSFPSQLRQAFNNWRVGATSIDDKEVQVLQGQNPRQAPVYFISTRPAY